MKSDNTVLQDFDKSIQEAEAKQKELEAKAEEQKEQEPEAEVAKSEDEKSEAKSEDKESDKDKSKDKKSDKGEDSKEDKPKDDAKEDKESTDDKKDKDLEDKKEPEVKKSVEPKDDAKKEDEELEESEDKEDEAKPESEKGNEPEGEVKKDVDESGAPKEPLEHDEKVGEINNPANANDFSAFNKTLTSGMSAIAKSFDLSQKQNAQANERLDHLSSELSELKGMLIDYMSTEKSLKDSEVVADEEPKEAEPVTDDEDVYVAEKSAAVSAPVEEDKAKDTEEVEKSLSFGDLREKALGLRSAYVDKFQKAADFGRISREDFLAKSENINKLANGRLSEQELKDFIEYVEK